MFVVVTVKVYGVPLVNPPIVHEVAVVAHAGPTGVGVTVYDATGTPPVSAGGVQDTVTCLFPGTPVTAVALPGTTAWYSKTVASPATLLPHVTATSTLPTACAGATAVTVVGDTATTFVAGTPPKLTPVTAPRFDASDRHRRPARHRTRRRGERGDRMRRTRVDGDLVLVPVSDVDVPGPGMDSDAPRILEPRQLGARRPVHRPWFEDAYQVRAEVSDVDSAARAMDRDRVGVGRPSSVLAPSGVDEPGG